MRRFCLGLLLALAAALPARADVTVTVPDSTAPWLGFMNWFELPSNGGGSAGASPWGVADLVATFDDPNGTLTLSPNTIGDPNPYWYIGGGGPNAPGNKIMEANLYQEVNGGLLSGMTVTFEGNVLSNTLTNAHQSIAFIRDFAADYSSFNEQTIPLTTGAFSLSLATINDPARHVQYGFQTKGVNVWVTDVAPFGSVVIGDGVVPEPSSLAAIGVVIVGGLVAARRRR